MNIKFSLFLVVLSSLLFAGCSSDEGGDTTSPFTVSTSTEGLTLDSEKGSKMALSFHAKESWRASVDAEWATVSPMTGSAGDNTIQLIAKSFNNTGSVRQGTLTLVSASGRETICFSQQKTDVVNLEQSEYKVGVEGGDLSVKFSSNIRGYKLLVVSQGNAPTWIKGKKDANVKGGIDVGAGEGLEESEYQFTISANDTHESRSCTFYIRIVNPDNHDEIYITSGMFTIVQDGLPVETSTDYSRNNTVKLLQQHSVGAGVPVVIMGDGFVDTEHNSGRYDEVMRQAMEQFFTEEPATSLRDYFDVWQVNMVSKNNAFGTGYKTALDIVMQGGGSSDVRGNFDKIVAATKNVDDMKTLSRLREALVIVVVNSPQRAGTTNFGISFEGVMSNFAIAYVPLINNDPTGEDFRSVLCHESLGHGLAKLLDEYAYEANNTSVPTSDVNKYRNLQTAYGWAANVSFSATNTPWNHILADRRYQKVDAYGEKLGVYEGACGYMHGAWRPTDDSMMFYNQHGFNAPSREAIYKRIMATAYGTAWLYDFNAFAEFDQAHLPQPAATHAKAHAKTRAAGAFQIVGEQSTMLGKPIIGRP